MNTSISNGSSQDWSSLPFYLTYLAQGFLISSGNLVIVFAIANFEALRNTKEFIIMLGLALADALNLAGYFFAGIYRTLELLSGTHDTTKTAWDCLTSLHSICWALGLKLSGMMLTVVSADRLLAVLFPLSYLGWTVSYARRLVGAVYLFNLLNTIYIYANAYGQQVQVPGACVIVASISATSPVYGVYYNLALPTYPVLSVFIYALVMLVLHKRFNNTLFSQHPNHKYELKRQRRVTVTLLFSSLCTLFVYVIPFSLALTLVALGHYGTVVVVLGSISNLNPATNLVIYPLRHREVRQAVVALFTGKRMPLDLKLWNPPSVVPQAFEMKTDRKPYVPRKAIVTPERSGPRQPGLVDPALPGTSQK